MNIQATPSVRRTQLKEQCMGYRGLKNHYSGNVRRPFSIVPSLDLVSSDRSRSGRDDHNHYDQCPFSLTQTLSFHTLKFALAVEKTRLSHEHQKTFLAKIYNVGSSAVQQCGSLAVFNALQCSTCPVNKGWWV